MFRKSITESKALKIYELSYGKKLAISDIVKVSKDSEYHADWPDEYIVTGMCWDREWDEFNVTIAAIEHENDGGSDGWSLDDLILVTTRDGK